MVDYVITGCAASGTGWAFKVMTELGSHCGHQGHFRTTGVNGVHGLEGDSSWCAAPFTKNATFPVVHVRRHPFKIVRSLERFAPVFADGSDDPSMGWVRKHNPRAMDSPDRFTRIMRFVALWGQHLDTQPGVMAVKADESDVEDVAAMYSFLTGREPENDVSDVLTAVGGSFNSHGGSESPVTDDKILEHPWGTAVKERAGLWGYSVDTDDV